MSQCSSAQVWIFALICVVSMALGDSAQGQNYAWERTTEELWAVSNVQVTAQGVPYADTDSDFNEGTGRPVGAGAVRSGSEAALGGGGGDGGGGANAGGDGARGPDGNPVDGADGPDDVAQGGKGGKAGSNGEASGRAHADGTGALNPDGQLILNWSYLHNQDASLDVAGGGEGGTGYSDSGQENGLFQGVIEIWADN